jgi:hypothetical protein
MPSRRGRALPPLRRTAEGSTSAGTSRAPAPCGSRHDPRRAVQLWGTPAPSAASNRPFRPALERSVTRPAGAGGRCPATAGCHGAARSWQLLESLFQAKAARPWLQGGIRTRSALVCNAAKEKPLGTSGQHGSPRRAGRRRTALGWVRCSQDRRRLAQARGGARRGGGLGGGDRRLLGCLAASVVRLDGDAWQGHLAGLQFRKARPPPQARWLEGSQADERMELQQPLQSLSGPLRPFEAAGLDLNIWLEFVPAWFVPGFRLAMGDGLCWTGSCGPKISEIKSISLF